MTIHLKIWRQESSVERGDFVAHTMKDVSPDMSLLELLDVLNEDLAARDEIPIEFDNDCREGICGCCGSVINGTAHGPELNTALCQLHMRHFKDGDTIIVEPWRSRAFPVIRDLVVDRTSFDRIITSGGYISVNTGQAPEASAIPVSKIQAEQAMDAAACIGCGACVAACPNASAALFVSAKISQLALLPQGRIEAKARVKEMIRQMDLEGFGNCSNHAECEAVCPQSVSIEHIARMRREYIKSIF
ncbi:MAG: succinate dehydrogenase/fumarate reductase iron-sulfur subunit [Acidobacteriota bacterium]